MQEGPENTTPLGTPPEGTPEPPVESTPEPASEPAPEAKTEPSIEVLPELEPIPLTDREVLESALEEAANMNNANARVEAKVDALATYILSLKS